MIRSTILLALLALPAHADLVTEFGLGWKFRESVVLDPACDWVAVPATNPVALSGPHLGRATASCGGDNPVALIWPIAWEGAYGRRWRYRVGWFHLSHLGDGRGRVAELLGGDGRETRLDCLCATATFRWKVSGR